MDFHTPPPRRAYKDYSPAGPKSHQARVPEPVPAEPVAAPKYRHKPNTNKVWKKLAVVVIIAIFAGLFYGYIHTRSQLEAAKNPSGNTGNSESLQLQDKIGRLAALPTGETPTIATVNDASKLKSQAFFANSKNGDKVLIFTKSGKAVLYRPSTNQIVEYSTVNLSGGTGQ